MKEGEGKVAGMEGRRVRRGEGVGREGGRKEDRGGWYCGCGRGGKGKRKTKVWGKGRSEAIGDKCVAG